MNSVTFQGSRNAPNFMRSVTGMSKNAHLGADIQVAAAMLKRAGLGVFKADTGIPLVGDLVHPTGPIAFAAGQTPANGFTNPTIDPLYLQCVITLAWSDGTTLTETIVYDPLYADMDDTCVGPWSYSNQTNVAADWNPQLQLGITPTTSPPSGFSYSEYGAYTQTVSPDGLTGVMAYAGGTDGTTVYFAQTMTMVLSVEKVYGDYCTLALNNIMNTLTLGNGITNFSGAQLASGVSAFYWTWVKSYANPSSVPAGTNFTNGVCGVISRANGVQYQPLKQLGSSNSHATTSAPNRLVLQCNTFNGFLIPIYYGGLPPNTYGTILAANGMPMNSTTSLGPLAEVDQDTNFISLDQCVPYILCVSTCVRNNTPMGANYKTITLDLSTNTSSIAWSTQSGLPSSPSQTEFDASSFSVGVAITCPYNAAATITPLGWAVATGDPTFEAPVGFTGSSMTLYSFSQDAFGNLIETIPATWSLINMTGAVVSGDLVASADGRSAVYSGAHSGTCQIQCAAAGLSAVPTVTIST